MRKTKRGPFLRNTVYMQNTVLKYEKARVNAVEIVRVTIKLRCI